MGLAPNVRVGLVAALLATTTCRSPAPSIAPSTSDGPTTLAAAPSPAPGPPPRGKLIALVYSTDVLAATAACKCPDHPAGGLARRATQIDRARREADGLLVVDAGDLLVPAAAASAPAPARANLTNSRTPSLRSGAAGGEIERRARLLAAAYDRIGITALTPGNRNLALGVPVLRRVAKAARLPLVSANLWGADGKRLFDADRIVAVAGVRVGVFGATAPPGPEARQAWRRAGIDARDPVAAAREAVASLRARGAAVVVALVHVGDARVSRAWAEAVPGVDWAVIGHAGFRSEAPEKVGTARLLGTLPDGREIGRLDLHVVGGKLDFADPGARADLEAVLADHRRQLEGRDTPVGDLDPASLSEYYASRRKQLEAAIAREKAALARLPAEITGSWFENRLLVLDAETPDHPGVAAMIEAFDRGGKRPTVAPSPRPPL